MIYVTQLIYIHKGQEEIFEQFERVAIPLISKYNGRLLLRIRPTEKEIIESNGEVPYEVHVVEFSSDADLQSFGKDEERKAFLHLKEKSVKSVLMFKGDRL